MDLFLGNHLMESDLVVTELYYISPVSSESHLQASAVNVEIQKCESSHNHFT